MVNKRSETRPKLEIPMTRVDYILEVAGWLFLAFLFAFSLVIYADLPEVIPSHFSLSGEADRFSNKGSFLFLPLLALVMFFGFTFLGRSPHKFNYLKPITVDNAFAQYRGSLRFLKAAKIFIALLFLLIQVHTVSVAYGGPTYFIFGVFILIAFFPLVFYFFTESSAAR